MYNPIINPELTKAKYTKIYNDIIEDDDIVTMWQSITHEYDDVVMSGTPPAGYQTLKNEFDEKYRYYEICDNDISVFIQCVKDTFHSWLIYFIQLMIAYKKEYDYALGNRKRTIRSDKTTGNRDSSSANVSSSSDKRYDLPHKETSNTNANGYMTDRNDTDNSDESASNVQTQGSFDSTVETIYDNEFLDLKRKYINQIRNINDEFADKFKDCFIHIFG